MEENIDIRVEWRPWQLLESSGGKMSDHNLYSAASSVMNYNRFFSFDGGVSCWSTELLNDNKSKQLMYWGCIFGTVFRWATMCSSIVPWFSCSWMNKQPTAVTSCGKMSELLPKSIIWVYLQCHTYNIFYNWGYFKSLGQNFDWFLMIFYPARSFKYLGRKVRKKLNQTGCTEANSDCTFEWPEVTLAHLKCQ